MKLRDLFEKELPNVKLFHVTIIRDAIAILKSKKFILTPHTVDGNDIPKDEEETSKSPTKYYFLSTARSPRSAFIDMMASNGSVLLVLNRNRLQSNNKVKPHNDLSAEDKWGNEMEDRVFSKTNTFHIRSPINNTITEIRLLWTRTHKPPTEGTRAFTPDTIEELHHLCKVNGITFKLYDNMQQFLTGR